MALVLGTNCGFVTNAPTGDPAGNAYECDSIAWAGKDTAPVGAIKVTEIGWWCDTATEEANFEVGIYDHNVDDDEPEAVVGDLSQTNAKGTDAGWKRVTGLNIPITASTIYWMAFQLDDTATKTRGDYGSLADSKFVERYPNVTSLLNPWETNYGSYDNLMPAIYAVYETVAQLTEGFLEVMGITTPTSAHVGDTINFTIHTQNTGSVDNFKVELSGDLTGSQEFSLGAGLTKDVPFSFIMPYTDVSITINTYHLTEEGDWVWDTSSVWGVNKWK